MSEGPIPFEDILEGYFTLRESLRQMAARHGFAGVRLTLIQAPVMDLPGLAEEEPVPLHLRDGYAGLIDRLELMATGLDGALPALNGAGEWRWFDPRPDAALPPDIRLGEPAFVRGFGLAPGQSGALPPVPAGGSLHPFRA